MRTAAISHLSDVIAILTASMTAETFDDSAVKDAVSLVIDDVSAGEPFDVACAAVGIAGILLGEVASVTGESRDDVLRRIALDIATSPPGGTDDVSAR